MKLFPKTNQKTNQMMQRIAITATTTIFMASCAGIPAPTEQMAVSKVAVTNATSAGGNEFAPLLLKSAMEKMDGAERAMTAKNYLQARQLAEQAQVDAQLAATTARSIKAQKAAGALEESNQVLRQEIDRKVQ
jgi:phosphate/sulfate permease